MKAVQIGSFGGMDTLRCCVVKAPEPGPGEVRVKVAAASFNPADYKMRLGYVGGTLPMVLGKDFSGVIDRIGEGVDGLAKGDEVYGYIGGPASNGTYAEYLCAPSAFVALKPTKLSFEEAAAVPLAGLTAYECVSKAGRLVGLSVFIAGGSGGVGSMAVQFARTAGAGLIIALAGSERSRRYLRDVLDIPDWCILAYSGRCIEEVKDDVIELNQGSGVNVAFDFVGKDMKRLCFNVLGFDGHLITIVPEDRDFSMNIWDRKDSHTYARSLTVTCEFLGARAVNGCSKDWWVYRNTLNKVTELIDCGSVKPPVITRVGGLSVETVMRAHTILESGHGLGKLVMTIG